MGKCKINKTFFDIIQTNNVDRINKAGT